MYLLGNQRALSFSAPYFAGIPAFSLKITFPIVRKDNCTHCHCEGSRREPVAIPHTPLSLRGFPSGKPWQSPTHLCHCEASRQGSRGNLGSQTKGLRTVLAKANLVF